MSQYTEYLSALRTNYKPAVKIDFLNPDGTVSVNVSNYYQDVSGTLTVNMQNGTRRTAEITIENSDNTFMITPESIWYGQKVKLWAGLFIDGSTPYYIPQGVFYVSSV